MFEHIFRTEPADTFGCLCEVVHSYNPIAEGVGVPDWYNLVSTLVENSELGEERVDGEGERTLEAETMSIETFWLILKSFVIGIWEGIAHGVEEIAGSHCECGIVVPPYFRCIFNFEYSELSIGGRETPIPWILDKGKGVI